MRRSTASRRRVCRAPPISLARSTRSSATPTARTSPSRRAVTSTSRTSPATSSGFPTTERRRVSARDAEPQPLRARGRTLSPDFTHAPTPAGRITAMGFVKDRLVDGLWMSTAGGDISKTTGTVDTLAINIPFDKLQIRSGGYGILDVIFLADGKTAWAVGGGGTIFGSTDGGATWQKVRV